MLRDELSASTAGLGTTITIFTYCIYLPFHSHINHLLGMNTLIITCIFVASWATLMFELWADRQRNEYAYKPLVVLTIITSISKPLFGVIAILATQKYKAEARIAVKGDDLFAEAGAETMYAAIDALVDKLERQLVRHKEKLTK